MGIGITIRKIKEATGVHYYKVITYGLNPFDLYITIEPYKKQITYFKDENFKTLLGSIQFDENKNDLIPIPEITSYVSKRVAIQALRAILKNEFPDQIGFAS